MVEHPGVRQTVWQEQRHIHAECSVVTRHYITFVHRFLLQAATNIAALPIPRIVHPPEGHPSFHRIVHLCILDGSTGIAQSLALRTDGVPSLIGILVF